MQTSFKGDENDMHIQAILTIQYKYKTILTSTLDRLPRERGGFPQCPAYSMADCSVEYLQSTTVPGISLTSQPLPSVLLLLCNHGDYVITVMWRVGAAAQDQPGILLEVHGPRSLLRGLLSCGCTKIPAQWHLPVQFMTIGHGVLRQCQHVGVNCEHCSVMLLYRCVACDLNDNQQHSSTMRVDHFQLSTKNISVQHLGSSLL